MSTFVAISVVIAAHNEEDVLGRCLDALLQTARPGELEIVVVCNGCTDRTADVARAYGDGCPRDRNPSGLEDRLPSTSATRPSRAFRGSMSMRTSRSRSHRFGASPRASPREMLSRPSPVMDVDLRGSSLAVRAYYRIWKRLPYVREGMIGVGVYALSEEGRRRFAEFPDIIADDGYVRMLFGSSERVRVDDAPVRVYAPERTIRSRTHQDPEPPRPVRAQAALPRSRRGRADDEVLRQRPWDDRRSTLAVAGRGVYAAVLVQHTSSCPRAARVHRRLRLGARSVVTSTRPALTYSDRVALATAHRRSSNWM